MYQYYFEKLDVFQRTRKLVASVYRVTDNFPADERFSMTSQVRRAALSILANIAEGNSRITQKDQAHFTSISFSSLMELLSLTMICSDLNYISVETYNSFRLDVDIIAIQLVALRKAQLNGLKV